MKKFNQYIIESKNTHMEHIEDLIFNEGVAGTRKAINFLRDLRDMLAGHSKNSISRTVKWDGAPAVFAGIDPNDGKFFVAKKGVFNKNPKVYKTPEDVKADTSGDLQAKLLIALKEFSKLGIKSGVYQGDLMFTKGDISREKIDGESYYTFQPNTIVYAVPVQSDIGRQISKANIGIVWHTTYTGSSFESMSASFGQNIVSKFDSSASIWQTDANYRDETGNATFTKAETDQITSVLSNAGKLFNKIPAGLINAFSEDEELLARVKVFNNTFVRAGTNINPRNHTRKFIDYLHGVYKKDSDKLKRPESKAKVEAKKKKTMSYFSKYRASDWTNLWILMNTLVQAKGMIINKMNQAGSIGTFLRTRSGFKVTAPEGFVAIDHLSNDAVKIVDRLEFSKANFSSDVIKGWQK
jgi:hypothetical protein